MVSSIVHGRSGLNQTTETPASVSFFCGLARQLAAERVEHDARRDAALRGGDQRFGETFADLAVLEDEALEADTRARFLDGVEHRREDFVTVPQDRVAVSRFDRCADERGHVFIEARIGRRDGTFDAKRFLILRDQQQQRRRANPHEHPQLPPTQPSASHGTGAVQVVGREMSVLLAIGTCARVMAQLI